MSITTRFTSTALAIATAATLVCAAATPVYAKDGKPKHKTVEMPASWLEKPTTKFCLPRNMVAKDLRASLSETPCQTREEWAALGIDIVARK